MLGIAKALCTSRGAFEAEICQAQDHSCLLRSIHVQLSPFMSSQISILSFSLNSPNIAHKLLMAATALSGSGLGAHLPAASLVSRGLSGGQHLLTLVRLSKVCHCFPYLLYHHSCSFQCSNQ